MKDYSLPYSANSLFNLLLFQTIIQHQRVPPPDKSFALDTNLIDPDAHTRKQAQLPELPRCENGCPTTSRIHYLHIHTRRSENLPTQAENWTVERFFSLPGYTMSVFVTAARFGNSTAPHNVCSSVQGFVKHRTALLRDT